MRKLHLNKTTNQILKVVYRSQSNCRKMKNNLCNFLQTSSLNKIFVQTKKKTCIWAIEFRMDAIQWWLNFVSCNFDLKSYLWFQIKLVRFWHHPYDSWPNYIPLSSVSIIYHADGLLLINSFIPITCPVDNEQRFWGEDKCGSHPLTTLTWILRTLLLGFDFAWSLLSRTSVRTKNP